MQITVGNKHTVFGKVGFAKVGREKLYRESWPLEKLVMRFLELQEVNFEKAGQMKSLHQLL